MQDEGRQQSFLPDRSMTYSTASSIYGRESTYDFPPPQQTTSLSTTNTPGAGIVGGNSPRRNNGPPSILFPKPEILLGNFPRSPTSNNGRPINGDISSPPARKRRKPSLNDPVLTHLLLQTALGDSGEFEILTLDELEGLKREGQSLRARITGLQRRLALETKVRDAAKSLVRLRSTSSTTSSASSSPKFNRRSSNLAREAQQDRAQIEYAEAERKCDALARELYNLEQRERAVQTRILQHTAGILQTTHHGYTKSQGMPFLPGARPDSPASLDGTQSRTLNGDVGNYDALMFSDASPYDAMMESLNTEPSHKRQPSARLSADTSAQQREMMMYLASGLEDLNKRMAAVLAKTNVQKAQRYDQFPEMVDEAINVTFAQRLDQLTRGLDDIEAEQTELQKNLDSRPKIDHKELARLHAELQASVQENMALQKEYDRIEDSMSAQLADMNAELYQVLSSASLNVAKAPPSDAGPMDSLEYTKAQLANVKGLVQSSAAAANEARQVDTVMQGLWAFMTGAEEDLRSRKRAEREQLAQKRAAGAQVDSEDEVSPDEDDVLGEAYSVQAFNTKVQWLASQALFLKEKQSAMRRKVKAHRERADRSLESAQGNEGVKEQLNRANELYATAKEELAGLEARTMALQRAQEEKDVRVRELQGEIQCAEDEARREARVEIEVLEQQLKDAQGKAATFEADLANLRQEREADVSARKVTEDEASKSDAELRDLRDEVVRLKTELTIAQAELEGAYGSRSQRAAETAKAANTEANQKLEQVTAENATLAAQLMELRKGGGQKEEQLRRELADTLKEFEELTKVSVEQEKERDELEGAIDTYRDKVEALEAQIAEDQVKWLGFVGDGSNSPRSSASGSGGGPSQSMSVMVLKGEFKKMMRDTRVESAKQLRAEQDERRRLEGIVRNLKKGSGSAGKGNLTYTMTA